MNVLKGKSNKWEFYSEIKFIAPYLNNTKAFVPYKSITGNFGGTGIYIGYRRMLNVKKDK